MSFSGSSPTGPLPPAAPPAAKEEEEYDDLEEKRTKNEDEEQPGPPPVATEASKTSSKIVHQEILVELGAGEEQEHQEGIDKKKENTSAATNKRLRKNLGLAAAFAAVILAAILIGVFVGDESDHDDAVAPSPQQVAKLVAADGAAGDRYGYSVAVSGDTFVVGAPKDEDTAEDQDSGSVYVYFKQQQGNQDEWNLQAKLNAPGDAPAGNQFGRAVAVDGDRIVVGSFVLLDEGAAAAPRGGSSGGRAFVYGRTGTNWALEAELIGDGDVGDRFGASVAIYNNTIVVGAFLDDSPFGDIVDSSFEDQIGRAYVYGLDLAGGDDSSWFLEATLTASDAEPSDRFGGSVATDGETIVVGAHGKNSESGSVYVYRRVYSTWIEETKLVASDSAAWDLFGYSVAVAGDVIVVGAFNKEKQTNGDEEQEGGARRALSSGSTYVFHRSSVTAVWSEQAKLTAPEDDGPTKGDRFGHSVATTGSKIVVGAYGDDHIEGGREDSGSVYIFVREDDDSSSSSDDEDGSFFTWSQQATKLTAGEAMASEWFGFAVAISGDRIVVGAPYRHFWDFWGHGDAGMGNGSVYVFE